MSADPWTSALASDYRRCRMRMPHLFARDTSLCPLYAAPVGVFALPRVLAPSEMVY